MSEASEVTRAQLEALLWSWIKDATDEGSDGHRLPVARLLHKSMKAGERAGRGGKNDGDA